MSDVARHMLSADFSGRYPGASGDGFMYGDPTGVRRIYAATAELATEYFECRFAFVQLLSGLHAMQSVISILCRRGSRIAIMPPQGGGHYATEVICTDLGLDVRYIPFDQKELRVDYLTLSESQQAEPVDFYYIDLSTALRIPDFHLLRQAVGKSAVVCFDASHMLGLLPGVADLSRLWENIDVCTASTHKTFPGPQKAVVLTSNDAIADQLLSRLPFRVSSGHTGSVAALGATLSELLDSKREYAAAVNRNARAFACALDRHGYDVAGRAIAYTETHQVWVAPPPDVSALQWCLLLEEAGIRATAVTLPSHHVPGLRLGVQELTRLGMETDTMQALADVVHRALSAQEGDRSGVRAGVAELARKFATVRTDFRCAVGA